MTVSLLQVFRPVSLVFPSSGILRHRRLAMSVSPFTKRRGHRSSMIGPFWRGVHHVWPAHVGIMFVLRKHLLRAIVGKVVGHVILLIIWVTEGVLCTREFHNIGLMPRMLTYLMSMPFVLWFGVV